MDLTETDDQLTIVNRSKEHRISKKLICKVPYFEKMLSHECLESRANKVVLDFDEQTFETFLDWLELGYIFFEMQNVINMFEMLDDFEILHFRHFDFYLKTYFHDNFTIEHLPIVIPQVTSTSKLINSGALNAFLCRHFGKIANTTVWLDYPVEIIEYICKMDLMICSEIQVFDAIIRWINFKSDARKRYLERLLNLVRWCHLEAKDLSKVDENEFFKSTDFKPINCSSKVNCDCGLNRTDQNYFIMIEELDDKALRIKVLDNNLLPLFRRIVEPYETPSNFRFNMGSHILHDENISDIFYGFERIFRVDWNRNNYEDLFPPEPYLANIYKCIFESDRSQTRRSRTFMEANERFIFIDYSQRSWYWPQHNNEGNKIFSNYNFYIPNYILLATVLNDNIYLLTQKLELLQFDIYFKEYMTIYPPINRYIHRYKHRCDFILTSKQSNDDRVILIDTYAKDAHCFNVKTKEWSSINHIIYPDSNEQKESCKLLTFTSAFLSMDIIRLCSPH